MMESIFMRKPAPTPRFCEKTYPSQPLKRGLEGFSNINSHALQLNHPQMDKLFNHDSTVERVLLKKTISLGQ